MQHLQRVLGFLERSYRGARNKMQPHIPSASTRIIALESTVLPLSAENASFYTGNPPPLLSMAYLEQKEHAQKEI